MVNEAEVFKDPDPAYACKGKQQACKEQHIRLSVFSQKNVNHAHKDEGSIMLTGRSIVHPAALLPVGDVNADPAMVSRPCIKLKPVRIAA